MASFAVHKSMRLTFLPGLFLLGVLVAGFPQKLYASPDRPPVTERNARAEKTPAAQCKEQVGAAAHAPAASRAAAQRPKPRQGHEARSRRGVHADSWAFSRGPSSRDEWRDGMPMETLQRRAVEGAVGKGKGMNTASGINSALDATDKRKHAGGDVGVSIREEASSWREGHGPGVVPDENLPMESRHVVGAYAGVKTEDDLSVKVGPELILKNEQRENPHADNRQPDSSLGVGMQFKLDF